MSIKGFGNYGGYNGDTIEDLQRYARNRNVATIQEIGYQIIEYMSFDEYTSWIDQLPNLAPEELILVMTEKLEHLQTEECTYVDPERTCPACHHAAYRVWYLRQEPVDSHLEAQYEQRFETKED